MNAAGRSPTGSQPCRPNDSGACVPACRILKPMRFLVSFFLLCAPALASLPNIVVVLTDDLGYGDIRVNNPESKIPTPSFDRIAREGVRFTDAHSPDGVCSPTRYGLLTGRYAWRTWLKRGVLNGASPPLIDASRLTLPEMLRSVGYATGFVGKWHLGRRWRLLDQSAKQTVKNIDWTQPVQDGPLQHGFDYSFGLAKPAWAFVENGRILARPTTEFDLTHLPAFLMGPNNNRGTKSPGFQFERMLPRFTEEATGFMARASGAGKPWFLYFAPLAPHRPVVPNPSFGGRSAAGLYGDFVAEVDWAVGEILAALERDDVSDNTLVVVTSDNGPEVDAYRRLLEYDHASMGTLRGLKRDVWEGGHRVPFVARWPERIPGGHVQDEVLCLTDLMATIAAIVDYRLPEDAAEDSYDLSAALLGQEFASPVREATVHHGSKGWFGIRQGDWVLVDHPTGDSNREPEWFRRQRLVDAHDQPVELFNLRQDPMQRRNLAAGNSELVGSLQRLLRRYIEEGRSVPR